MYYSKSFINTLRDSPQEADIPSHRLMIRANIVSMLMAGVYSYLPLGVRILENIKKIIREEMNLIGAEEVLLPALQPMDLWNKTERYKLMKEIMITFKDRRSKDICLGPTHEEVVTNLVGKFVQSYKQLPFCLYQIQTKFRDELRPRFGLVRSCEFIMKDAYSFDKDEQSLDKSYQLQYEAYCKIFKRCGLDFAAVTADSGVMGGSVSHEFLAITSSGEDKLLICPKCSYKKNFSLENQKCPECKALMETRSALEIGHIFKLGTKYSDVFSVKFLDKDGVQKPVVMGCYGIGVSRIIAAVIEQNHDDKGIIWPKEISPFCVAILALMPEDKNVMSVAQELHSVFEKENISCLLDDRNEKAGIKFNDADLLGFPLRVTLGKQFLENSLIEIKKRNSQEVIKVKKSELVKKIKELLK
ncbi:MAG: proline--tRNA ligase [Candidatus Gygaella obscura]|nr:proline--tRNA ligase [Candidatus Gygaella obscura]